VAYHFGFVCNGYILWYKPTFDVALQNYSPSKIHIAMLIEDAISKGLKGFDFLQGAESYKAVWSNDSEQTSSFIVEARKFSPAYYWITQGRPLAERRLGRIYNKSRVFLQKLRGGGAQ
jgi:CelD/BcsL family acetyltransferase involved in cellulose biosynthesis